MTRKSKKDAVARKFNELGLTSFEKSARYLATKGVEITGSYLAMIVGGKKEPALPLARKLAAALDLEVSDVVDV